MVRYITEEMPKDELLTDRKIREIAKRFAAMQHLGEDRFKASSGWIENFKQRHGIKRGIWHGEGLLQKYSRSVGGDYAPMRRPPEIDLSTPTSVLVSGPQHSAFTRPSTEPTIPVGTSGSGGFPIHDGESDDDEMADIDHPPVSPSRPDHGNNTSMVPQVSSQPSSQPHLEHHPQSDSQPQPHQHRLSESQSQNPMWIPEPHHSHEQHVVDSNAPEIAIMPMPITHRDADGREHVSYVTPEGPQRPIARPTPTTAQALEHLYHLRSWALAHLDFVGFDDSEMIRKLMIDVENYIQGIPLAHRGKM